MQSKTALYQSLSHAVGITDNFTNCDCCGRTDLKRTVVFEVIEPESDDSVVPGYRFLGTSCAKSAQAYVKRPQKRLPSKVANFLDFKKYFATATGNVNVNGKQETIELCFEVQSSSHAVLQFKKNGEFVSGNVAQLDSFMDALLVFAEDSKWNITELGNIQMMMLNWFVLDDVSDNVSRLRKAEFESAYWQKRNTFLGGLVEAII